MAFIDQEAVFNHMRKKYKEKASTTDFGHTKLVSCEKYGRKFTATADTWDEALEKLEAMVEHERSKHPRA